MPFPIWARALAGLLFASAVFPAQAADLAFKARPALPASNWTGFYVGGVAGYGFGHDATTSTPNDPATVALFGGLAAVPGAQPVVNAFGVHPGGIVGGFEAGYNWQVSPQWVVGFETDISGSGLRGQGIGTSLIQGPPALAVSQNLTVQQAMDWYGTVRGRAGFLVTPGLLLFGTAGLAYGGVRDSATFDLRGGLPAGSFAHTGGGFSFSCLNNTTCFSGSNSAVRVGWTAGAGLEWLFDRHWSTKIEYQFVGLGTETIPVTAFARGPLGIASGAALSSFNTRFQDGFSVVRAGVNYHF